MPIDAKLIVGGVAAPTYRAPAAQAQAAAAPKATMAVDGFSSASGSNPVQQAAAKLKPFLPPGVEAKVDGNRITFISMGEPMYAATLKDGAWTSGGFRQHGFKGHPDSAAVRQALQAVGMELPPAPIAPPMPAPSTGGVKDPGPEGYAKLAEEVAAQLPTGFSVTATEYGLRFASRGEPMYSASVRDGAWFAGGFRQHGLKGHPDSQLLHSVLQGLGLAQ